ncbi:MAG: hypothetical protein KKH68_12280 [Proteobacteria bacterium]|nr:hypothetical protein [Pseudomonadota bacterium]
MEIALNCWEFMKCGYEKDGYNAKKHGVCPAFPDYGKSCARVVGTLCGGKVQGTFADKIKRCKRCKFYNSLHYYITDDGVNLLVINSSDRVSLSELLATIRR